MSRSRSSRFGLAVRAVAAVGLVAALLVLAPVGPASGGPTRAIVVEKVVDGEGPDGPYDMTVSCSNDADPEAEETIPVAVSNGDTEVAAVTLTGTTTCTVTEDDAQGASSTSFECSVPGTSDATCQSASQGVAVWSTTNTGDVDITVTNSFAAAGGLELVNVSGSITLVDFDPLDIEPGSAGFTLEWDTSTGDVTGTSSFGSALISQPAAPPDVPVDVCVKASIYNDPPTGNTNGTIDPDTGEVEFTSTNGITFDIWATVLCPDDGSEPTIAKTAVCTIPSFDIPWVSTPPDGENFGPLPFDPDADYGMTIHATFEIPAIPSGGCTAPIEGLFNTTLGLPGEGSAILELERGTPPEPSPTPAETPTAVAPTTPAAVVTTGSPTFTG
jgi:hypothetical protein